MWASSSTASGSSASAVPPVVGLTTNVGGKPVTRVFGQPLDPESGNAPGALLKLIQYLQKRGKNTPGLYRKPVEEIAKEVDALRKGVMLEKDHLQVASYTNSPSTAAEVMRQLLAALPDPLLTCDLYDSFLIALKLEDRLDYWRLLLAALPPGFKATTEKTLSLLHLLHTHSTGQFPANGNYAQNLGPIFAPVFLRPRALGPHMAHDAKLAADVTQNLIEHMPSLFDAEEHARIDTNEVSNTTTQPVFLHTLRGSTAPAQ
ncbi:RhoGAP domain containing protein [Acanthamoeba castellanii str. Neff]|uniref:RhoGAP domain containing protein n=1 Tax=Acanthamoeba castellanii (strain ATCC 30010 / Neff) TaxID=1257118 RepID=L8H7A6_ACACF|nr:RhoGAP domain containing protein [Acanthamoeba castellanii str. Neff]ELR20371.1 RhoGAP domain containing protein [Acanthamoeba castellanii str. Neff]